MKKFLVLVLIIFLVCIPYNTVKADDENLILAKTIYDSSSLKTYFSVLSSFDAKEISHVPSETSTMASEKRKFVYVTLLEVSNMDSFNFAEYIDEVYLVDFTSGIKFPVNKELSKFVSKNHPRMKTFDYELKRGEGREFALIFDIPEEMAYQTMYLNIRVGDLITKRFRLW